MALRRDGSHSKVRHTMPTYCWLTALLSPLLRDIYKYEGLPALFKGLGPTLVGVIPARSINFFVYGNGKQIIANKFNDGKENSIVHLVAAATAGPFTPLSCV